MKKKDEIHQELEDLGASKLADWHKRSASQVLPDEYWNDHIDRAITAGRRSSDSQLSRRFSLSYIATIAAAFLMLLAGTWMFFQYATTESDMTMMANELAMISDAEIVQYIDANLDDFDFALLSTYAQEPVYDLLFEVDASLDSMEENWPEDTEWLMPVEEGVDLF